MTLLLAKFYGSKSTDFFHYNRLMLKFRYIKPSIGINFFFSLLFLRVINWQINLFIRIRPVNGIQMDYQVILYENLEIDVFPLPRSIIPPSSIPELAGGGRADEEELSSCQLHNRPAGEVTSALPVTWRIRYHWTWQVGLLKSCLHSFP